MEFVAYIGEDQASWGQVTALLNRLDYDKAVLLVDKHVSGYPTNEKTEVVSIDSSQSMLSLQKEMQTQLRKHIGGEFEVALSLASGTGKEHMALLSALLQLPVGIKLVVYTKEGVQFLT